MRILCVCLGNICRSPTAEAILRALDPTLSVDSAGTSGWHLGKPPYGPAIAAGARRGYDLAPLRARRFQARDFRDFDLILAMDSNNLAEIERQRPPGSETPVRLFLDSSADHVGQDVPDPYYSGDFDRVLDLLEVGARALLRRLGRT